MFNISEIKKTVPEDDRTLLETKVFTALEQLNIPYEWVDTDEAVTMADCTEINRKLDVEMVKTIFLCNRKKTSFFLFITTAEKRFDTKAFRKKLQVSHLSFAPSELMESRIGTKPGAATVFGVLLDEEDYIQVIIDQEVVDQEWYGCSTGTTTSYMRLKTRDLLDRFLPFAHHKASIIEI